MRFFGYARRDDQGSRRAGVYAIWREKGTLFCAIRSERGPEASVFFFIFFHFHIHGTGQEIGGANEDAQPAKERNEDDERPDSIPSDFICVIAIVRLTVLLWKRTCRSGWESRKKRKRHIVALR